MTVPYGLMHSETLFSSYCACNRRPRIRRASAVPADLSQKLGCATREGSIAECQWHPKYATVCNADLEFFVSVN